MGDAPTSTSHFALSAEKYWSQAWPPRRFVVLSGMKDKTKRLFAGAWWQEHWQPERMTQTWHTTN
jgi:hypothetical protein